MCISKPIRFLSLIRFFFDVNELFKTWSYEIPNTNVRSRRDFSLKLVFDQSVAEIIFFRKKVEYKFERVFMKKYGLLTQIK